MCVDPTPIVQDCQAPVPEQAPMAHLEQVIADDPALPNTTELERQYEPEKMHPTAARPDLPAPVAPEAEMAPVSVLEEEVGGEVDSRATVTTVRGNDSGSYEYLTGTELRQESEPSAPHALGFGRNKTPSSKPSVLLQCHNFHRQRMRSKNTAKEVNDLEGTGNLSEQ